MRNNLSPELITSVALLLLAGCASVKPPPGKILSPAEQAREFTRKGQPLEAMSELERILARQPADLSAHRWYVEAATEAGQLQRIEGKYRAQLDGELAGFAYYALGLIEAARGAGHEGQALEHLEKAAELLPQAGDIPYRLGLLRRMGGNLSEAARAFEKALELDPRHCEARVSLAEVRVRLGEEAGVLELLKPLLEQDCSARAMEQGRAVAARIFNPARLSEPDDVPDLERALDLMQQDLVQQALSLVDKVLARAPSDSFALALKGLANSRMENFGEAVTAFEEALARQPQNVAALLGLGDIYFRLQRLEKARGYYEKAVVLNPLDPQAQQRLGELAQARRDFDTASAAFARLVKLTPQDLAGRHLYALALFQAGRPEQAIAAYEEILRLKEDDLEALMRLGSLYGALARSEPAMRQQRRELALYYLKRAYKIAPENQAISEMMEKIKKEK
jgi:tetratricopeptide (TPR) repeat protein